MEQRCPKRERFAGICPGASHRTHGCPAHAAFAHAPAQLEKSVNASRETVAKNEPGDARLAAQDSALLAENAQSVARTAQSARTTHISSTRITYVSPSPPSSCMPPAPLWALRFPVPSRPAHRNLHARAWAVRRRRNQGRESRSRDEKRLDEMRLLTCGAQTMLRGPRWSSR